MIRISKIILYFTVTVLLAWLLPWCYSFVASSPGRTPFTLYSTVTGEFALLESNEHGTVRRDANGRGFTDAEFDSILPFFYYRQLVSDERFPDTIQGVAITPRMVQNENFMFRSSPRSLNATRAEVYPLLESMSGRVDLQMPEDVFRIDRNGMTFIDCKTNMATADKSEAFTAMLRKKDFVFPAGIIAGNPTTRKEYDEGFFVTDSAGKLFHLKQTKGRPFVRAVPLPAGVELAQIFVTEFRGRRSLAFLTDQEGKFYVLRAGSYELAPVNIPALDLTRQGLTIVGNPFDWTIQVSDPEGAVHLYAVDAADFSRIKELNYPAPLPGVAEKVAKYIFPFQLSFTSGLDMEVFPRITDLSVWALVLGIVLAVMLCLWRRKSPLRMVPQCLFVVFFGLYAFVGLLLFPER